jgi:hypothetical protein
VHFSFKLTRQDLVVLQQRSLRRLTEISGANRKLFFANLLAWIPLGIAIALFIELYRRFPSLSPWLNPIAAALVAGLALAVWSGYYKQRLYKQAWLADDGWFLAEQTVDADAEGLRIRTARGETRFAWAAFMHRAEDDANLYLFIDNAQAVVIPKSALGSAGDAAQFRAWSGFKAP